jgi:hypothetical protein
LELRTTKGEKAAKEKVVEKIGHPVSTDQLLQPAQFSLIADDGNFYTLLQKATWDHLGTQLKLSGSKMNKDDLLKTLKEKNMEVQFREILAILQECEAAAFTKAKFANDKHELLNRAKEVLGKIKG